MTGLVETILSTRGELLERGFVLLILQIADRRCRCRSAFDWVSTANGRDLCWVIILPG